ncbi:galactokinase [Orbus mooreae]|uniref:galactokinase n=1 Tax=Orbus mooreae TaxID=3074107 RepID=UPI00370D13F4
MKTLVANTNSIFLSQFDYPADTVIQAPGRVNLIGEHTDYNDGFVLPCAINYQTVISCKKRNDDTVRVIAADYDNQLDTFSLTEEIIAHPTYLWANYIRGVMKYLQLKTPQIKGVDLVVSGNVPQGAGLSSSASLEVAIAKMMQTLYDLPLSGTELALIGQEAENKFVSCNCGIMDQLISSLGKAQHALLIDCRTLGSKAVSMPENMSIVIINSNIKRGLVDSEYNTRRKQCEQAAKALGVKALRDARLADLLAIKDKIDPVVFKRAHHIITENDRTEEAAQALADNNYQRLSELMAQSHQSMKNDFEITVPAIDYLVEIIGEVIGNKGGVRMTGGGFGGCVVALVPNYLVEKVQQTVKQNYQSKFNIAETFYVCQASDGAGQV